MTPGSNKFPASGSRSRCHRARGTEGPMIYVRFSNRPSGIKHFQAIQHSSVDVAHGLALLFGLGTRALPSWDSKTRWYNLLGDLAVNITAGSSGHTNSPHPSSREGHHSTVGWIAGFLLFDLILHSHAGATSLVHRKVSAVNPDAVHDHGQPTRQCHDRLLHPAMSGDLHRPGLEPGPFRRTHQHDLGRFVEHHPHHLVSAP